MTEILTPLSSMVILCWYWPSNGYPKKPIAKLRAEASIRSLKTLIRRWKYKSRKNTYWDSVRNTGKVFVAVKFYIHSSAQCFKTHVCENYLEQIAVFDTHGYAEVD